MLTYESIIFIGVSMVGVIVVYTTILSYLLRQDRLREENPSLSDSLLPSDVEAQ